MVGTGTQVGEQLTERYKDKPVLAIAWTIQDIRWCERNNMGIVKLTDEDCIEIMKGISMKHDPTMGVNWDVIYDHIEEYVKQIYPQAYHEWQYP